MFVGPFGHTDFFDRTRGLLTPWSFVPHHALTFDDDMTYTQRIHNLILSLYDWWLRSWVVAARQNEIAQRHFKHLVRECTLLHVSNESPPISHESSDSIHFFAIGADKKLPSVEQLHRNVSLIFVHSHRVLNKPRPMMPGIVNIGGCHIRPPRPLATDLQGYLDRSPNGVIIFSMGSLLPGSKMPIPQRDAFLEAFGRLEQNVIWKFEDDSMPTVPSNVRIQKWLPQSDIIAHPNVVLLITHGGLFRTNAYGGFVAIFLRLRGRLNKILPIFCQFLLLMHND